MNNKIGLILLLCLVGTAGFSVYSYSERSTVLSQLEGERGEGEYWQSQYESLNDSYFSLSDFSSLLQENYSTLQSEKEILEGQYEDLNHNYTSLSEDYSSLQGNYTSLVEEYLVLMDERGSILLNLTETIEEMETWISSYETLNNTYLSLNNTYTSLLQNYTSLLQNYTEALDEIDDLIQRIAQLEGELNFTDFSSLTDLEQWLAQDNINEHEYIPDEYDCDDFAYDLMVSAFKSGYKMGTVAVYYGNDLDYVTIDNCTYYNATLAYAPEGSNYYLFGNHMVNIANVGDTGWVLIEPQTDSVYPLGTDEL